MDVTFRLIGIVFSLIFWGCKLQPETPVVKPIEFDKVAYQKEIKELDSIRKIKNAPQKKVNKIVNSQIMPALTKLRTDTVQVKIQNGKARIDTIGQRLVFVFNSDTANKFSVKVSTTDTISRLRIDQIINSKNHSEGPFGLETDYLIKEKGLHKVIISEESNNTNSHDVSVSFEVKLGW